MSRGTRLAAVTLDVVAVGLGLAFLGLVGGNVWMGAKGMLAEHLISRAFAEHVDDGGVHLPWSWADVHPVAALQVPRLGVRQYILSGASGASMAFGAGHVDGTGSPNGGENCVLAGHRDTRFAFLQDLRVGDEVVLTTRGKTRTWLVEGMAVVDDSRIEILEQASSRLLTLVTCYPFQGITSTSQRFVVWCRPGGDTTQMTA